MIALAVDLALRRSGYAVLDGDHDEAKVLGYGVIAGKGEHDQALAAIALGIDALLVTHAPAIVFIEVPGMMNYNRERKLSTVVALAEAKGVALAAAALRGVPTRQVNQEDVKQAIGGTRKAAKTIVHQALANLALAGHLKDYNVPRLPRGGVDEDIADAVAIGVAGLRLEWVREHYTNAA